MNTVGKKLAASALVKKGKNPSARFFLTHSFLGFRFPASQAAPCGQLSHPGTRNLSEAVTRLWDHLFPGPFDVLLCREPEPQAPAVVHRRPLPTGAASLLVPLEALLSSRRDLVTENEIPVTVLSCTLKAECVSKVGGLTCLLFTFGKSSNPE